MIDPAASRASRLALFLAIIILIVISGCSLHRPYLSGEVTSETKNDALTITYDIHIKNPDIDSVAFQLLPADSPARGVHRNIYYASEERVKDSIVRSLGDSLPCCFDFPGSDFRGLRGTAREGATGALDTNRLCWWQRVSYPIPEIDSILAAGPLDSLRKVSVSCGWKYLASRDPEAHIDTILQADSAIFSSAIDDHEFRPERIQKSNGSAVSMRGRLCYPVKGYREPARYALKLYSGRKTESADQVRRKAFVFPEQYAREMIWKGVIPARPETKTYATAESGNMLGMLGGIGAVKNDIFTLPSRPAVAEPRYGFSLDFGVMYYTPHFIHAVDFALLNSESPDDSGGANNLGSVMLSTRSHPRRAVSRGPYLAAGCGYSDLSADHDKKELSGEDAFDLRLGGGYETSFDRIEYAYHIAHGGYHRFDLLVGMAAMAQGKAGLRWSLLTGDQIRTSAIGVYMENRFFDDTMRDLFNRRSLLAQAALYAGMIAGWAVLFE